MNLASLYTPAKTGNEAMRTPVEFHSYIILLYNIKEGANPKETASHNESNSTPNSLVDLVNLAIIPSKASNIPAIKIQIAALS